MLDLFYSFILRFKKDSNPSVVTNLKKSRHVLNESKACEGFIKLHLSLFANLNSFNGSNLF